MRSSREAIGWLFGSNRVFRSQCLDIRLCTCVVKQKAARKFISHGIAVIWRISGIPPYPTAHCNDAEPYLRTLMDIDKLIHLSWLQILMDIDKPITISSKYSFILYQKENNFKGDISNDRKKI